CAMKSGCPLILAFSYLVLQTSAAKPLRPPDPLANYPFGNPIPIGPQAVTEKQICCTYRQWGTRVMLNHYRRLHENDTKTARFLQNSFSILTGTDSTTRQVS